jgi:hypothetical protein
VLEPLAKILSPVVLSSAWIALGVWAIAATVRTYLILSKLLKRMESEF